MGKELQSNRLLFLEHNQKCFFCFFYPRVVREHTFKVTRDILLQMHAMSIHDGMKIIKIGKTSQS